MNGNIRSLFCVTIAAWCVTGCQGNAAEDYQPRSLSGMTIQECVHVLNYQTKLQVNLELARERKDPRYSLDLTQLTSTSTVAAVEAVIKQGDDYTMIASSNVVNIVPKSRLHNAKYPLDLIVGHFATTNADLVTTFELLVNQRTNLAVDHPFLCAGGVTTRFVDDVHRKQVGGEAQSMELEPASLRSIFNQITGMRKMYWIATPSERSKQAPNMLGLELYSVQEAVGSSVIWDHDPILKEKLRKHEEEQEKLYLENLKMQGNTNKPVNK